MGCFTQLVRRYVRDWMDTPPDGLFDASEEPPTPEAPAGRKRPARGASGRFRVLSFNVWGLPHTPHFAARMGALQAFVASCEFDVVALQELWLWQDRDEVIAAARRGGRLVHSYYFRHGVGVPGWPNQCGSGLLVLSRHPVVDAAFLRFSVNGLPYRFDHLDGVSGKGVGLVRLAVPGVVAPVDVYVTHLVSVYTPSGLPGPVHEDTYRAHRVTQAYELAKFVRATRQGDLVVLAGDFNSPHSSLCLRLARNISGLVDSFEAMGVRPGPTFSAPDNGFAELERGLRLDHVLFSTRPRGFTTEPAPLGARGRTLPDGCESDGAGPLRPLPSWRCDRTAVFKRAVGEGSEAGVMTAPARRGGALMPVMLSDHYGITAEFVPAGAGAAGAPPLGAAPAGPAARAALRETLLESRAILVDGLRDAKARQRGHCTRSFCAFLLATLLFFGAVPVPAGGVAGALAALFMYAGMPYAMVEIILGVFTVETECVVLQETLQQMGVDLARLRMQRSRSGHALTFSEEE